MPVNQKNKQRKKMYPTRIYLDNFSTYNHMYNEELLADVGEGNIWMFGHWNTCTTPANKKVYFGSIECWINKKWIAIIFSIPKLRDMGLPITYDSRDGKYIFHTKYA